MGQRLVLFGAWLMSCGFVYVLGVYVGKGMRGGGEIAPRVALPVDATVPPAPTVESQAPLTFSDVLGARDGRAPAAPAPPPTTVPRAAGSLQEERLAGSPPPAAAPASPPAVTPATSAATLPQRPVAKPATPAPAAAAPAAAPARADTPASPAVASVPAAGVAAPERMPPAPAAPPVAKATPAPAPPSGAAALPPQASTGRWTVYASPSRDRLAVEHERAALRAKGYPAEVVMLRRDGDTWYRIRVGRYATQAQADEASRRLRTDGVGHAFVQSE